MGPHLVTSFGQIHCQLCREKAPWAMMNSLRIAKTSCMQWQTETQPDTSICTTWILGSGKEAGMSRGEKANAKGCMTLCQASVKAKHFYALKKMA